MEIYAVLILRESLKRKGKKNLELTDAIVT